MAHLEPTSMFLSDVVRRWYARIPPLDVPPVDRSPSGRALYVEREIARLVARGYPRDIARLYARRDVTPRGSREWRDLEDALAQRHA